MTGADAPAAAWPCPCCGAPGAFDAPPGSFGICAVCGWQDCPMQAADPDEEGGPNGVSLTQARANYRTFGVIDPMA